MLVKKMGLDKKQVECDDEDFNEILDVDPAGEYEEGG